MGPVLGIIFSLPFANVLVPLLNFILLPKARKYLLQGVKFSFKKFQFPNFRGFLFTLPQLLRKPKKASFDIQIQEKRAGPEIREYKEDAFEFCSFCTEVLPECGDFLRKSQEKGWQFFHVLDQGNIQGGMILSPVEETPLPLKGENYLHISCLMLRQEIRGQGVGRALVNLAIERAKGKLGVSALGHKDFIPSGFWEHLGFKMIAQKGPLALFLYSLNGKEIGFLPQMAKREEKGGKDILEAVLPPYCSFLLKEYRKVLKDLDLEEGMVEIRQRLISNKEEMADFPFFGFYLNGRLIATGLITSEKLQEKILRRLRGKEAGR
ncbi:MAG: GNAT family N-acetyltransferase [bacterium]